MTATRSPADVVLIEDQHVLTGAIELAFRSISDLQLVGSAGTLARGRRLVAEAQPDLVVCDFRLPDGDIPDQLPELLRSAPATRVVVFTSWPNESSFIEAMAAGAHGFLDKATPFPEFLAAMRRVIDGEVVVSPQFIPALTRRATEQHQGTLTRRELEVLQLLADGLSTEEIAKRLFLSLHTVRNHIARVITKLGVNSRLEAVNVGVRQGLIRHDPPTR